MLENLSSTSWAHAQLAIEWVQLTRQAQLAASYFVILSGIAYLLYRRLQLAAPEQGLVWLLILLTLLSGLGHAIDAFDQAGRFADHRGILATLLDWTILFTAIIVWPAVWWITRQPSPEQLREEINRQLRTLEELRGVRGELERQVAARTAQLREAAERFDIVLRQSPISVFSQDKELRYTWLRNPLPGFPESVIGRSDEEVLPAEAATLMREVKQLVMACGEAHRAELLLTVEGERRWYDVTVEPLRAVDGNVIGTTSAAIDITHRKQSEQLLEMLLREVTHRSKNLLAVIRSIVRHTTPNTSSGRDYASRLGAHLQAMSITHDMLVEANWKGVSLQNLIKAQLGSHVERRGAQIKLQGEEIVLGPTAADSIGLVIHELADNAAKNGALTNSGGNVTIEWSLNGDADERTVTLDWKETGGRHPSPANETGIGRILLEQAVGLSLSGELKLELQPDGMHCEITIPGYYVIHKPMQPGPVRSEPMPISR